MPSPDHPPHVKRRRWAMARSLWIASAAAFAGGVGVVGVQYGFSLVQAGYPPVVQALICEAASPDGTVPSEMQVVLHGEGGNMLPVFEFPAASTVTCRIDAPGADFATWSVLGPERGLRSGPLDPTLPCQSPDDFASQSAADLRLSVCQRVNVSRPGTYLLSVTAMLRGQQAVDRARAVIRVLPAPASLAVEPRSEQLVVKLRLPAMVVERTEEAPLSASFGEHGLLPQSRWFERVAYRLAPGEHFESASFRASSASNASAVKLAYVPQSRAVTASFTLRSGSVLDRWRGWVTGTVAIRLRHESAAREVVLPPVTLPVPGQVEVPVPEGVDAARAAVELAPAGDGDAVTISPGVGVKFGAGLVTLRVAGQTLVLHAERE